MDNYESASPAAPVADADVFEAEQASTPARPAAPAAIALAPAKGDKYIWGIYITLCLISLIELYSASSREVAAAAAFGVLGPVVRHAMILFVGFLVMLGISRTHYKYFAPATYLFVAVSVVMMIYVMLFGEIVNGARRSISLPGIQLQPAEFIKLSAVLTVTLIMSRSQLKRGGVSNKGTWMAAAFVLFFGGLLAKQGLTNTLLVICISMSLMLVGGVKITKLLAVVGVYILCGGLFVGYLSMAGKNDDSAKAEPTELTITSGGVVAVDGSAAGSEKSGRLATWIARVQRYGSDSIPKWAQPIDAKNRQEMYAYMAQANGGTFGVGPGNSREAARLPLAFSDFIYSIIIEDMGLVGGVVVLIAYLALLGRAAGIASRCSRAYPALLVLGMALMIVFQALVHMAIVTGVSPVSGQPLPLISKGGSSILITSVAFGVMLSVSRFAVRNKDRRQDIRQEIDLLPEDLRAENPGAL